MRGHKKTNYLTTKNSTSIILKTKDLFKPLVAVELASNSNIAQLTTHTPVIFTLAATVTAPYNETLVERRRRKVGGNCPKRVSTQAHQLYARDRSSQKQNKKTRRKKRRQTRLFSEKKENLLKKEEHTEAKLLHTREDADV